MRLIGVAVVVAIGLTLAPLATEAQEAGSVRTIGWLSLVRDIGQTPLLEGLHELGWIEGRNLRIERRSANGQRSGLRDLANELVGLGVEVLVAGDSAAIEPARQATSRIPIAMTVSGDPATTMEGKPVAKSGEAVLTA